MGGDAARSQTSRPSGAATHAQSRPCSSEGFLRVHESWCDVSPHPASPKLTSFAKAAQPSPTRGEEAHLVPPSLHANPCAASPLASRGRFRLVTFAQDPPSRRAGRCVTSREIAPSHGQGSSISV